MARLTGYFVLSALLVVGACGSDDNKPANDAGSTPPDATTPPKALECGTDGCTDFVFDSLLLPASSKEANDYAADFNNDGTPDNQLGQILSALANIVQDLALQPSVDEAVNEGNTVILLRVQAADLSSDPKAAAQAWLGQPADCCPTDKDPAACATETKTTCFKGDFEFKVDPSSPDDAVFGGAINGGTGTFGPSTLALSVPLKGGSLDLVLRMAQITATFAGGKITKGTLAGGITEDDLDNKVLPSVHKMLEETIATGEDKTKEQILQLFDADEDGQVTLEEVRSNDIIKAFLQGDVDVDGDGTLELSLGVGFTAVPAKISK